MSVQKYTKRLYTFLNIKLLYNVRI